MEEQDVKLLGAWGSPFSKRVEIALKLKGIPYDYKEEDVYNNKSDELLKCNPIYKKVPVLIHKGQPIVESLVILEYIDESWQGYPLMPEDPYKKSQTRFWAKFVDEKCLPSLWKALWATKEEEKPALDEANENLRILEKELQGKKFFGGESIGYVDIVSNFIAFWVDCIQEVVGKTILTKERYPNLTKWAEDFVKSNIIMDNLPQRDPLVAYFRFQMEAFAKASKQ